MTTIPDPVPVLFVASGQAGGAERYLETLLELLDPEWIEGAVLLGEGPVESRLERIGIEVEVLTGGSIPSLARQLRRRLRAEPPAVVHANGIKPAAVAGLAALALPTPVLWLKVDMALGGWRSRAIGALCTEVVGMSEAALASLRGSRVRTRVVFGGIPDLGIDPARGRAKLDALTGWGSSVSPVVLSGRLCPGKGQLELIETAPAVLSGHPEARFALIGREDPAFPGFDLVLRERMEDLDVAHAFALLSIDRAEEAIALLGGADVVTAPSVGADSGWREGFGLVVAEAMQLGRPVVIYRSGSLPEVLGSCGRTVPEGDRAALAAAILELLEDPAAWKQASDCGRRRAVGRFSIARAAAEMAERYAALGRPLSGSVSRRGRPPRHS